MWRNEAWDRAQRATDLASRNPGAARMGGGTLTVCYAMRGHFQAILTFNSLPTATAILFKKSIVGL